MKNKIKLLLIILTLIFGALSSFAQNKDEVDEAQKVILHKIDSIHPNKTHVKWDLSNAHNKIYTVSFEWEAYFFKLNDFYSFERRDFIFDSIKVGKKLLAKFDSLYPEVNSIEWYPATHKYAAEVSFDLKESYLTLRFDEKGDIVGRDRMTTLDSVPADISKYLKQHYSKFIYSNLIDEKTDATGHILYYSRLDIEYRLCSDCGYNWVIFNKEGDFVSEEHVPAGI